MWIWTLFSPIVLVLVFQFKRYRSWCRVSVEHFIRFVEISLRGSYQQKRNGASTWFWNYMKPKTLCVVNSVLSIFTERKQIFFFLQKKPITKDLRLYSVVPLIILKPSERPSRYVCIELLALNLFVVWNRRRGGEGKYYYRTCLVFFFS